MKYINIIFVKKSIVAVDGGKRQGGGAVAGGKSCGIVLVVWRDMFGRGGVCYFRRRRSSNLFFFVLVLSMYHLNSSVSSAHQYCIKGYQVYQGLLGVSGASNVYQLDWAFFFFFFSPNFAKLRTYLYSWSCSLPLSKFFFMFLFQFSTIAFCHGHRRSFVVSRVLPPFLVGVNKFYWLRKYFSSFCSYDVWSSSNPHIEKPIDRYRETNREGIYE